MSQHPSAPDPRFAAPPGSVPPGQPPVLPGKPRKRRNWIGRTIGLVVLLFLLVLICVPLYAWSKINKVDAMPSGDRPAETPGTTYLLVGSDSREGLTKEEGAKLGTGAKDVGKRTDTIMLLHKPASDGPPVLVSLPRDSYVKIPGHGSNRINAAFAFGGPKLLVQTIEQNTGLRIDEYVEIGFGGFVSIVDSVGGIHMCLPKAMKDKDAHINLPAGCQELTGKEALGFVRARKSVAGGDLGRVENQRKMVGAIADKVVGPGTVLNPWRYYKVATSGADALTIDNGTGPLDMFGFARAMQSVSGKNGVTLTVPVSGSDNVNGASVLRWDREKALALFKLLKQDKTTGMAQFAQK